MADLKAFAEQLVNLTVYLVYVPSITQTIAPFDSSVGRAEDCSEMSLKSLGRWFYSGSKEFYRVAKPL